MKLVDRKWDFTQFELSQLKTCGEGTSSLKIGFWMH